MTVAKPATIETKRFDPLGPEWIETSKGRSKMSAIYWLAWVEVPA